MRYLRGFVVMNARQSLVRTEDIVDYCVLFVTPVACNVIFYP